MEADNWTVLEVHVDLHLLVSDTGLRGAGEVIDRGMVRGDRAGGHRRFARLERLEQRSGDVAAAFLRVCVIVAAWHHHGEGVDQHGNEGGEGRIRQGDQWRWLPMKLFLARVCRYQ